MYKYSLYIITLLLAFTVISCKKGGCNVVPNVTVYSNFSIAEYPALGGIGVTQMIPGGVAGIAIYSAGSGKYIAYDRCSTVNPEQRNAVIVDPENTNLLKDPVSGAKWFALDGSPVAIAECPLKPYYVTGMGIAYSVRN